LNHMIAALPINVFSVGPFGRAVIRHLKSLEPGVMEAEVFDDQLPSFEKCCQGGINVVASWRPVPGLCDSLDQFSNSANRPLIPLILESSVLRLGPVIIPGEGGCWQCWARRSEQYSSAPDDRAAILEYYLTHPHAGPKGYLEPFAMLGAVKIKETVERLRSAHELAGLIWQIDLSSRQMINGILIGIHNCPRCGLGREGPARSIDEMRRCLKMGEGPVPDGEHGCA